MTSPARRVLVTGTGGFIGRHVLEAVPPDWEVVAVSRQPAPARGRVTPVVTPGPDDALPGALVRPFDAAIHLAGNADHGLAVRAPWADLAATGVLAASLLGRIETTRLVVLSSAAVYAGLEGPVGPDTCVDPPMAYALSKRYVEGLARALVATDRVGSAAILRLYNAFGPGERPSRLIPRVAAAARERRQFVLTGSPLSLADPIHVDDVVRALVAATEGSEDIVLDWCGGDPTPLPRTVERIAAALGFTLPDVVVEPDPTQVPIRFWSDPRPAARALRIDLPEAFDAAVRRYATAEGWVA